MSAQINTMDEGRPPENINLIAGDATDNEKNNINRNFSEHPSTNDLSREKHLTSTPKPKRNSRKLSIVSLSKNHTRSKKYGVFSSHTVPSYHRKENGNIDTTNLVGEDCTFTEIVEDNSKRMRDTNKNTAENTSSQVPLNTKTSIKCEKNGLKSSFVPKLLCLTKNSLEKSNYNLLTHNKNNLNIDILTKSASNDSLNKEDDNYVNDSLEDNTATDTFCDNSNKVVINKTTVQTDSLVAKRRSDEKSGSSTASSSRTSQEGDYTNYGLDKSKIRNSFHQNVEEALNSLLWQPYEYQKSNATKECECGEDDDFFYSEESRTPSWSSCSSDLDEIPFVPGGSTTKGTTTKNPSDVVGSTVNQHTSATRTILQAVECTYLRSEDLHSNVNSFPLDESVERDRSRDAHFEHSTNAFEPVASLNLAGGTRVAYTSAVRSQSSDRVCDVSKNNRDRSWLSMSHAHNATVNQPSAVTSGTNSFIKTAENGLRSYVDSSLNSANIVGLPSHHARYASVPSTAFQNGASRSQSTIFPQHVRHISEPARKFQQNFTTPHSSSTLVPPNAVVPSTNVVPIHRHYSEPNHFRSHSAPKSMPKNEPPSSIQQVNNPRTKPHNMQSNVVPTSGSNQIYIQTSNNVQNNVVPTARNSQLLSQLTAQNRFPVVQNSSTQQYQVVPNYAGHQQVPYSSSNASAQNASIFTVNPKPNYLVNSTQKLQNSLTSPNSGSITQSHPIPNPRLSKLPQQSTSINANQQNVSNINVNFYRAVPVNVVSSVPTIHCLNTLSNDQGNSVSNVQVLPLGSTFQQSSPATNPTYTVSGSTNVTATYTVPKNITTTQLHSANAVDTATQITLHNANAIQIAPTSGFHINRNSAFSPPQNHDLRNVQAPNKSGLNTIVVPLNEVVVQDVRPMSTTSGTIPSGRLITTTAQINSISTSQTNNTPPHIVPQSASIPRSRTFTSTEAQTDEIILVSPQPTPAEQNAAQKEQRRKERRERRNHRRAQRQSQTSLEDNSNNANQQRHIERLPDILDSHLPPPYSAVTNNPVLPSPGQNLPPIIPTAGSMVPPHLVSPSGMVPAAMLPHGPVLQTVVPNAVPTGGFVFPAPHQQMVPGQVPLMQGAQAVPVAVPATATGFRFPFPANGFRRTRFSDDTPKGCCGFLSWKPGSLRWFIALIALVAVCCVLVGTALGAMRPAGRDHLTVSLLMIGVGIVLITVSGVAWRLTSHDSSTCRSMLGLGSTESVDVCTRRFVPRLPPSYGRPHHPYAAMMYPEFQYRPPPPSYQASMQEYRLRLLLLDRGNTPQIQAGLQSTVSPPPTYRSHAGSLLRAPLSSRRDATQSEYSCPPSYRSQNSSHRPATLHGSILHSREHSLSVSDSNPGESVVNVVNILGSAEEDIALDTLTLDSLKMEPEHHELSTLKMLLKGSHSDLEGSKDGNLVTIVQTNDQNPVIVTVSGCSNDNNSSVQITEIPSEMEILAHL